MFFRLTWVSLCVTRALSLHGHLAYMCACVCEWSCSCRSRLLPHVSLSRNELQGLAGIFIPSGGISAHQQSPACAVKQRGNSFCAGSSYFLSVCVCALLTLTNSLLHANLLLSLQFRLLPAFVCSPANCTMRMNFLCVPFSQLICFLFASN